MSKSAFNIFVYSVFLELMFCIWTHAVEPPIVASLSITQLEGVPRVTLKGTQGSKVQIEISNNLKGPWVLLTNSVVEFSDTALPTPVSTESSGFYRVRPQNSAFPPSGFVWIPPGTFVMGSPSNELDRNSDEYPHTVIFTSGLWMSDHEVTQSEYESVKGVNPSYFKDKNRPVENVNWQEAIDYCVSLTKREQGLGLITTQQSYRLPTESEWEYAARAGNPSAQYGELNDIAWWAGNSGSITRLVKLKQPNNWGLYDMIGNVREWCSDSYGVYPKDPTTDPKVSIGMTPVFRGGSIYDNRTFCRFASRGSTLPIVRSQSLGFRVVINPTPTSPPVISIQPQSVKVFPGESARLFVNVAGSPPLFYQWYHNSVAIAVATKSELVFASTETAHFGEYRVVVTNAGGSVTSSSVLIENKLAITGPAGFVWIPPGTFLMGSPISEAGRYPSEFQHPVTIKSGFWMSDHETTQAEYQDVMGKNPSSNKSPLRPVEQVGWLKAIEYCQKLTQREKTLGKIKNDQMYRLPTEAEWEYAARAGTTGARYGDVSSIAWFDGNSVSQSHPVKEKIPNAWRLYDMIGNVWEWCSSIYGVYPGGNQNDLEQYWIGNPVTRGGGWTAPEGSARASVREAENPNDNGYYFVGFRAVLSFTNGF
jgi:formylglycine-generating enzyme required for sulfatase activity